jgi:branched-chain amino acid aminotransferase
MSLYPSVEAHSKSYADNMFLDPKTRTYVEESGGANILFVKEDGTLVVPQSFTDSILPSVTRRSLVDVAEKMLGMKVEQRPVKFQEILDNEFVEAGMCGTAAVISPVGEVDNDDVHYVFKSGMENVGPVMKKLRETLTGIQSGEIEDQFGWVHKIC